MVLELFWALVMCGEVRRVPAEIAEPAFTNCLLE